MLFPRLIRPHSGLT